MNSNSKSSSRKNRLTRLALAVAAVLVAVAGAGLPEIWTSATAALAEPQFNARAAPTFAPPQQTPATLCKCNGGNSSPGGIRSYEEFRRRFGSRFKSDQDTQRAWQVYQAVNRCDSVIVLGRNTDTGQYENRPGYCVLRTLEPYSIALNDVFLYAGTDRDARFLLISEMPPEAMRSQDNFNPQQVELDREKHGIVIYNHEIHVLLSTNKYHLPKDLRIPAYLASSSGSTPDAGSRWAGTYANNTSVLRVSGGQESLTATEQWKTSDRFGSNQWSNCHVSGNVAKCQWTGIYQGDPDKTANRHGTLEVTLNGDTLSGSYYEDEPSFSWKVSPYPSAMHKGAVWPINMKRQ